MLQALLDDLETVLTKADSVLARLKPENLERPIVIQGRETTVIGAIYHVVEHFAMHTGQIIRHDENSGTRENPVLRGRRWARAPHLAQGIHTRRSRALVGERPSPILNQMKGILIVDHGSTKHEANHMLEAMAELIQTMAGSDVIVRCAHMELAEPDHRHADFARCVNGGATEVIALSLHAFTGPTLDVATSRVWSPTLRAHSRSVTFSVTPAFGRAREAGRGRARESGRRHPCPLRRPARQSAARPSSPKKRSMFRDAVAGFRGRRSPPARAGDGKGREDRSRSAPQVLRARASWASRSPKNTAEPVARCSWSRSPSRRSARSTRPPRLCCDVQNTLVNYPIAAYGNEEQKAKYLPLLTSGDGRRLRALGIRLRAPTRSALADAREKQGDRWMLNGQKLWITNGAEAGVFVVFANANPSAGYKGITAFIVERDFPGIRRRQEGRQARHPRIRAPPS